MIVPPTERAWHQRNKDFWASQWRICLENSRWWSSGRL